MGTAQGSRRARGRATRGPLPCSRGVQASLGCTAATSSSPWVQRVCRGDTGTPARQSQPGPEHPTCWVAGTAPTELRPEGTHPSGRA